METIAVFNTRGGSGKSAATVFLTDFLTTHSRFKKRVLVVDLDPQRSSSVALLGEERLEAGLIEGKSLARLMLKVIDEAPASVDPNEIMLQRPQPKARKGTTYLGEVSVLGSSRHDWKALNARLGKLTAHDAKRGNLVLTTLLAPLKDQFDICFIDFPAHETGPITRNGLRAAGWWVFPCVPDRSGSRDIEGPVDAFLETLKGVKHRPKGLGTLLSICQNASSREYKQTYNSLHQLAEDGYIPPIFKNKLLFWPSAREALDDTRWGERTTLKMKYPYGPLYNAAFGLSKELLKRLDMPFEEAKLEFGLLRELNKYVTKLFVGAKVN